MARNVYKLRKGALEEIMNSAPVQSMLMQSANQMKSAAESMSQEIYDAHPWTGKVSAHATVQTWGCDAYHECLDNNTLLKAMDSGRV